MRELKEMRLSVDHLKDQLSKPSVNSEYRRVLERLKSDISQCIEQHVNAHYLRGPMEAVTKSKLFSAGAVSHLAVVVGLLCLSKSGDTKPYFAAAAESLSKERCYLEFLKKVNESAAQRWAKDFLGWLDYPLEDNLDSDNAYKRAHLNKIVQQTVEETGDFANSCAARLRKVTARRSNQPAQGDNDLIVASIRKAYSPTEKEEDLGTSRRNICNGAVRSLNHALINVGRTTKTSTAHPKD